MEKITEYIRKSHSFTKEALDHLSVLNKYMGDIGESAVLRYLIANEIRKVPAFQKETRITLTDEDTKVYCETELNYQIELARRGLPSIFSEGIKEEELAKLRQVVLINRLIGKSFDGHKAAEVEIKGFDADAINRALWGDEEC